MSHTPEPWVFEPDSSFGRPIVTSSEVGLIAIVEAAEFGPLIARCPRMYGLLRRLVSLSAYEDFHAILTESLALIEEVEPVPDPQCVDPASASSPTPEVPVPETDWYRRAVPGHPFREEDRP